MRIAMIGTRGVPAAYGGFETAVEEIGRRLAARGHSVTVYCRDNGSERLVTFLGMKLVYLPALRLKVAETLSHTALSVLHAITGRTPDIAFVFNAANSPFLPMLRARRVPTALHMDGLEWKRGKWGRNGRRYYRFAELLGVRFGDALIADAQGIADYYTREFAVPTELIAYGAPIIDEPASDKLDALGLAPGGFHLVVARFEPENHVAEIVDGYHRSAASLPLVVVGSAPYAAEYTNRISATGADDDRVRLLGGIWDQELLDQLYANALTYLHGHSVGGTNPSLLRAMGAGTAVIAWDVDFNREVLGEHGTYFASPGEVGRAVLAAESDPSAQDSIGASLRERARTNYDWETVTDGYEDLARRLARGSSIRPLGRRAKRNPNPADIRSTVSVGDTA